MVALLDRTWMTTATTGTGTVTISGAVAGYLTAAEAGGANGVVYPYLIMDGTDIEAGVGTYSTTGPTVSRDAVGFSKISGTVGTSKINLSGNATILIGVRAVDVMPPSTADKFLYTSAARTWAEGAITAAGRALLDDTDAAAQLTTLGVGTGDSPQFAGVNIGHASDTTITRTGAGDIAVEGNAVYRAGGADVAVADGGTGASTAAGARASLGVREVLSGARTYYVRTDGSDSNDGLTDSAGGAFVTMQQAINTVAALDLNLYNVTIQVGNGTYTGAVSVVGSWVGSGVVTLQGNTTTPSNVVISTTNAHCIAVSQGGRLTVKGFKFTTTTSGTAVSASTNGTVTINGAIEVGVCATYHFLAQYGGTINVNTNYTISGGSTYHYVCAPRAGITCVGRTITLTGTPAFTSSFIYASRGGVVEVHLNTYSGSATGTRYVVDSNAVLFTNGAGATYLPGDAAGTSSTGGQYI